MKKGGLAVSEVVTMIFRVPDCDKAGRQTMPIDSDSEDDSDWDED